MKKLGLILLVCLMVGVTAWADDYDRTNTPLPKIGNPLSTINNILWWHLEDGQWKSSRGDGENKDQEKIYKIESVPIIVNDESYTGIVCYYITHYWDYPAIYQGYHEVKTNIMFTLTKDQMEQFKFDDINKTDPKIIELNPFCISEKNIKDMNSELQNGFNKQYTLIFNILPLKSKNVIRFTAIMHDSYNTYCTATKDFLERDVKNLKLLDTFKDRYYETDFDSFNKVFQIMNN